jgi:hypothetical protein
MTDLAQAKALVVAALRFPTVTGLWCHEAWVKHPRLGPLPKGTISIHAMPNLADAIERGEVLLVKREDLEEASVLCDEERPMAAGKILDRILRGA